MGRGVCGCNSWKDQHRRHRRGTDKKQRLISKTPQSPSVPAPRRWGPWQTASFSFRQRLPGGSWQSRQALTGRSFLVRRTCPIPLFQLCFQRLIRRTHVRFSGAHRHHLDEPHRDFFLLCKFNQFLRMQFFFDAPHSASLKDPPLLAAQMPCFTCSSASRPVSAANSAASTVSRLTFTLSQPAAFRSLAHDARRTPFVVIPTDAVPGTAFIFCTSSTHSFLTSGSLR